VRVLRLAAMSTLELLAAIAILVAVVLGSTFLSHRQVTEAVLPSASHIAAHPVAVVRPRHVRPGAPVTRRAPARTKPAPHKQQPILTTQTLAEGDSGPVVLAFQRRLTALGYWVGTPDGYFGDSTLQAVWALQKAAGLTRNGVAGPAVEKALAEGIAPTPRPYKGYVIEVNLSDDLLMFVRDGKLLYTLNTSTGGGYTYWQQGYTDVAATPTGVFHIYTAIDAMVTDSLGQLYRPRYFYEGFAIHGEGYVPPFPVSHGCVRVSDEAIDWVWADNMAPMGTTVWVYG
jgi:N-acetylmuramoyl-L-alanine amidase